MRREIVTRSAEETIALGREIGQRLTAPAVVLLAGELGAGKTTLAKGIVSGLGAAEEEEVTSPTFTLIHKYQRRVPGQPPKASAEGSSAHSPGDSRAALAYHVDLYRVTDAQDLGTLGLEEVFAERVIVIVEWPEKLAMARGNSRNSAGFRAEPIRISLEHVSEQERRITIEAPPSATSL